MVTMRKVTEGALISELQLSNVVTVATGTSIKEVAVLMREKRFGCVPIVKNDTIIGIFTERDWLTRVLAQSVKPDSTVDSVMTANPITLRRTAGIWEAAEIMAKNSIRHIPIVDSANKPVAMLSVRDILQYLAECFPEQFLAHPPNTKTVTLQQESG